MCAILVLLSVIQQSNSIDKPGNIVICQKTKLPASRKGKTLATVTPRKLKQYLEGHILVAKLEGADLPSHWQHLA